MNNFNRLTPTHVVKARPKAIRCAAATCEDPILLRLKAANGFHGESNLSLALGLRIRIFWYFDGLIEFFHSHFGTGFITLFGIAVFARGDTVRF